MAAQPIVLVTIMEEVIASMRVKGIDCINYEPGRAIQILQSLSEADQAPNFKDTKFPLIAMYMPVPEKNGSGFSVATIGRIVIATLTDSEEDVLTRYKVGGTFGSILYPVYYEFLKALGRSKYISGSDPTGFVHTKLDNPGRHPIGKGINDYIDSIEILNLELILHQIKIC